MNVRSYALAAHARRVDGQDHRDAASCNDLSGEGRGARAKQRVVNAAAIGRAQMPDVRGNRTRRHRENSQVRRDERICDVYGRTNKAVVVGGMVGVVGPGWLQDVGLRGRRNTGDTREITQMDVAERERDLQRQREQRQRSRKPAVRSMPTHDRSHPTINNNKMLADREHQ
jgi:hypothetical protein